MVAVPSAWIGTVISWQTATGVAFSSSTVTTAIQVAVFPFTSKTVSVTSFVPTLEQSNVSISIEIESTPQASELPPSTSAAVMTTVPLASNCTVMSWQTAMGATESSTVTSAIQLFTFPLASVTVSVTSFTPTSEQSNVFMSIANVGVPQLSVEPPSTSVATIVAIPLASSCTVISWHNASGTSTSSTVTTATQEFIFPFISVTVSVTLFVP